MRWRFLSRSAVRGQPPCWAVWGPAFTGRRIRTSQPLAAGADRKEPRRVSTASAPPLNPHWHCQCQWQNRPPRPAPPRRASPVESWACGGASRVGAAQADTCLAPRLLCAHLAAPSRLVMAAGQRLAPGAVQPEPGRRGSLDRGHRDTGTGTPGPHWSGQVVTGTGRSESVAGPSPVHIQGSVLGRSLGPNFEHHEAHDEGQAKKRSGVNGTKVPKWALAT